jgi:hypothetical protein
MSIGDSSVGEFAVAELPASGGLEIAVGGRGIIPVTALVPSIVAGATVTVPTAVISLLARVPDLKTGILIASPAGSIPLVGKIPQILQSSNNLIPVGVIGVIAMPPNIGSGVFIDNPSRQDQYISTGGSVGGQSVGEFAVTEGAPEVTLSGRRTARLPLSSQAPSISAGKLISIPAASISLLGRIPEIDSRRRKVRAKVMLS